ncbi:hypothetical protein [Coralloluteibacterium stylophorae]|uniref:Uncharacterized protein n=1 Tax=Coralloluteibacterium stylophorae TaxID=1776034 RepID=A0A8J7VQS2_9GAMM|nr:hypothetical protein [Coralloluteibacterium stylophorae]MBS7458216.1 hypothetical protein [Coralloluteibacterium stylophorae]
MRPALSVSALLLAGIALAPSTVRAAQEVDCEMRFSLSGWSVFYKTASGSGMIRCDNGQSMPVTISAKGGGLTFGKSTIDDGIGEFSGVIDIEQTLGSYASAEAHAGATKSSKAMVVTKGEVSLALSGVGRGWDLGVGFGKFTIERAR